MECKSLQEIQEVLESRVEPYYVEVHGLGAFASRGILIRVESRGTGLTYAFPIGEFWSTVDDLELEADADAAYEQLASQISDIEGIRYV